ncbi:MAG: TonB-dependent receptor plug domain-containing protein [candidate division WOR-3 bacterium]
MKFKRNTTSHVALFCPVNYDPETQVFICLDHKEQKKKLIRKTQKNYCNMFTISKLKKFVATMSYVLLMVNFSFAQTNTDANVENESSSEKFSKKTNFPNAIYLSREDINGILVGLVGDDPNGVASLLALKAGLTFRNTGDAGAETWFIVRNFGRDNSRMTLVLLDGRPLNLSNNHTVEFDDIPVNIIESITIYPGPVPAQYGGYQSVIEIKTQHNEDLFFTGVNMGSQANYRFTATLGKSGRFHYLANFDFDKADGQSNQRLDGILSDFQYGNREVRTLLPTFKIGYEITNHLDVSLQGNFVDFKKMFNTEPLFGQEASRRRMMHNYALVLQPGRDSDLDYHFIAYQNREIETLNPIFPEDTTYNLHWGKQNRTMTGFRGHYRHTFWNNKIGVKAGGEGHWTQGRTDDDYIFFKYKNNQNFIGGFVEVDANLWKGSFITLGGRIDKQNEIDRTYFSPVGSISQQFFNNQLSIYASYGMQRRWIPLNEVNTFNRPASIFGPPFLQGNVLLPETNLSMELLRAFDAGVSTKLFDGKLFAKLNYFYLSNEGQYGSPVFEIRPVNSGAPVPPGFEAANRNFPGYDISQGIELDIQAQPLKWLSVFANATYFIQSETRKYDNITIYEGPLGGPAAQPAINQSVGHFVLPYNGRAIIPGTYDWLANIGFIFRPDNKTIINTIARYRGITTDPIMKFGVDPQVENIPSSLIMDVSVGRDILDNNNYAIRLIASANNLFASANNLFNTNYQTFVHYPMQGTFYSFGITATLK